MRGYACARGGWNEGAGGHGRAARALAAASGRARDAAGRAGGRNRAVERGAGAERRGAGELRGGRGGARRRRASRASGAAMGSGSRSRTMWRCAARAGRCRRCWRATAARRREPAGARHRSGDPAAGDGRRSAPADAPARLPAAALPRRWRRPRRRRGSAGAADLPPLRATEALPPDTLIVDIAAAERLLGVEARVSRLLLPAAEAGRPLPADLAGGWRSRPPGARRRSDAADRELPSEPDRLRRS